MGFGPPPTSPFVAPFRDELTEPGAVLMMTVTIPYDNATKVILDPITTHRDVGCAWANFVTSPGTPSEVNIPVAEGDGTMPVSALGLGATPTITDLENAGYGATS